jgi:hypothetical protein
MEELMKKKIIWGIIIGLLIVISIMGGYYIGQRSIKLPDAEVIVQPIAPKEEPAKTSTSIAVVNLDMGIARNGVQYNYGMELINQAGVEVIHAALEVARGDVEKGNVGAYIIIPANFSESVNSINTTINRAVVEYGISPNITTGARETVIEKINSICNSMNNGLSHVYVSAILNSVYEVQDDAISILGNDKKDLETLEGIQISDIIQFQALPELVQAETDTSIEALDLGEQYELNHSLFSELNNSYSESLAAGQADLNVTKEQWAIFNEKIGVMNAEIGVVNTGLEMLSNLIDTTNTELEEIDYREWINNINTVMEEYDAQMAIYAQEVQIAANEANEQITNLHTEAVAAAMHLDLLPKDSSDPSQYKVIDPSVEAAFFSALSSDLQTTTEDYTQWEVVEWDLYIREIWNTTVSSYYLSDSVPDVNNIVKTDVMISLPSKLEDAVVSNGQEIASEDVEPEDAASEDVMPEEIVTDNITVKEYINRQVQSLAQNANDDREILLAEITDITETKIMLQNGMASLATAIIDVNTENAMLSNGVGVLELQSYIDTTQVSGLVGQIGESQSTMQMELETKLGEYQQIVMQSSTRTQENMQIMQDSVLQGNEQTSTRLEEELSWVKQSRVDTSAANGASLYNISQQLLYARNGSITNESLLRYMTEPLIIQNRAVATIRENVQGTPQVAMNNTENTTQIHPYIPWAIGSILIFIMLAIIIRKIFERIDTQI